MSQPIGILSDTHDQVHHLLAVIEFYNQQNIRSLIHCGDWISPFVLSYFSELNAPIYGVFGNNDGDKFLHARVAGKIGLDITMEDQLLTLEVDGRNLAAYHGTSTGIVQALAKCGDYDAVFYGHNHRANIEMIGETLLMNPGTLLLKTNNKVQGASVGLYDPENNTAQIIPLEDVLS